MPPARREDLPTSQAPDATDCADAQHLTTSGPRDGLVRELQRATQDLSRKLGARVEDIADLIQDFWVAYCDEPTSTAPTLHGEGALRFITQRVRWRLVDLHRRQAALRRFVDLHDPRAQAPPAPRTLDQLIRREEARRALRVIETLPDAQREVIRLVFLEDLSQAEVALRLGVTENAVKQRVKRAVAELRSQLYVEEESP